MAENSKIAWCDDTFNSWVGCTKVSPGCKFCYAERGTFARTKRAAGIETWGPRGTRIKTSEANWRKPLQWNRAKWFECLPCGWRGALVFPTVFCPVCGSNNIVPTRRRVFCASMADVFEYKKDQWVALGQWRAELFKLIEDTPNLDWLICTKRPENILEMLPERWNGKIPDNIWMGTTTEDQESADKRVPALLSIPARVRWLSVEPMLEPIYFENLRGIDWVICGGESGAGARPMAIEWARNLRDQCKAAGVSFFMKQLGGYPDKRDQMTDFPADLQIREFPL